MLAKVNLEAHKAAIFSFETLFIIVRIALRYRARVYIVAQVFLRTATAIVAPAAAAVLASALRSVVDSAAACCGIVVLRCKAVQALVVQCSPVGQPTCLWGSFNRGKSVCVCVCVSGRPWLAPWAGLSSSPLPSSFPWWKPAF